MKANMNLIRFLTLCYCLVGALAEGSSGESIGFVVAIVVVSVLNVLVFSYIVKFCTSRRGLVYPGAKPVSVEEQGGNKSWSLRAEDLKLADMIGQGTLGATFKATFRGTNVAVKQITYGAKQEAKIQGDFEQILKLRHPFLVLLVGLAFPEKGKAYIVTEYMSKGSLFRLLHDHSVSLDWKQRVSVALAVARAMNYLHQCRPSILHKNLNSFNVLLDEDLQGKLSDYGLDSLRSTARSNGLAAPPFWTAPEVFRTGKHSKASDVYSFGVVLWELLTREQPYDKRNTQVKLINAIESGLRPSIPPKTPGRLVRLIEACWVKEAEARPSFDVVVSELTAMEVMKVDMAQISRVELTVEAGPSGPERKERKAWMVDFNELKLQKIIGHGAFGEVWQGLFRGKKVAIKMLKAVGRTQLQQFVHELNIMSQLKHPNIVLFIAACVEDKNRCMVMEYCEKGNLFDILQDSSQSLDYSMILKILTEIASGVLYLHTSNPPILHRDLKSVNILLDEHWNVKVSDFGLTDFKDSNTSLQLGTPFWLAPEAMEQKGYTEAADVYSFGMVCWELFTREIPFSNMNPHQAALAVYTEAKRPDIPAFVPQNFQRLIRDCWHQDAKRRPTLVQVLQRLEQLRAEGLPRVELSLHNAQLYRKKAFVYAFPSKDVVVVSKSWGTGQAKRGDWVVVGPNADVYTCDATIFASTYVKVGTEPHLYRKVGKIFARQMPQDFLVQTLEGMEKGKAGDFLAQNPKHGEQWPIAQDKFMQMYELAPEQTVDDVLAPGEKPVTPPSRERMEEMDEKEDDAVIPNLTRRFQQFLSPGDVRKKS